LQRTNQSDTTAVVFTSDHGDLLGDHSMLDKRGFYEESTRVPLLFSVPWLRQAQQLINSNVSHVDLVPTLLELLDHDRPEYLQGTSRLPLLTGPATNTDNDVFLEWNGKSPGLVDRTVASPEIARLNALPWRSVVSDRWKLNLCVGDRCELFNLQRDPFEETNLFNDPSQADRIGKLAARIRRWQHRTGDTAPLPSA
jgi:arylsulfatase A-like enzyme